MDSLSSRPGAVRAAKLLLILGEPAAVPVIAALGDGIAEPLARALSGIASVGLSESVGILADFVVASSPGQKSNRAFPGGPRTAARLMAAAFGAEKAESIMQRALS